MKNPPAARIRLLVDLSNTLERRAEWEAFLRGLEERGYEPSVVVEPSFREELGPLGVRIGGPAQIRLNLPQQVRDLDLGAWHEEQWIPFYEEYPEKGRLLRYAKNVSIGVTGIRTLDKGTEAVAEYEYEWQVDEKAKKFLEEDVDQMNKWAQQFSFLKGGRLLEVVEIPELKGRGETRFALYDDGWRMVKTKE
jgi:hypothetical protein